MLGTTLNILLLSDFKYKQMKGERGQVVCACSYIQVSADLRFEYLAPTLLLRLAVALSAWLLFELLKWKGHTPVF